jgi:aconitase B
MLRTGKTFIGGIGKLGVRGRSSFNFQHRNLSSFKTTYENHVAERRQAGVVPKPLDAAQTAELVALLKNPPVGEETLLMDLLVNRIPPGVDEAAYVKAAFLTAVAKGEASSPLVTPQHATELLGTMQVRIFLRVTFI